MNIRRTAQLRLLLFGALLTVFAHTAVAEEPSASFAPERWGFRSIQASPLHRPGATEVTYSHDKNGRVIRQVYSPLGTLETESESTTGGRLLWRREIYPDHTDFERFDLADGTRSSVRATHSSDGTRIHIHSTRWIQGTPSTTTYWIPREEALSSCVAPPTEAKTVERLMSDLRWLKLTAQKRKTGETSLGNNIVAENCDQYPGGGNAAIAKALEEGLQQGLRCLHSLGPARSGDIARLLSYLNPKLSAPVRILCGKPGQPLGRGRALPGNQKYAPMSLQSGVNAQSFFPDDGDFPGMLLNVESRELQLYPKRLKDTLFNEMLHFLGYIHGEGIDLPYLTEACCFAEGAGASSDACELLKGNPDFRSPDYQTRFATIMVNLDRPVVAANSAWKAALTADPRRSNPLFEAAQTLALANPENAFSYSILAQTGIALSPKDQQARMKKALLTQIPPSQRKDAQAIAEVLAPLIRRDKHAFEAAWKNSEKSRKQICTRGSEFEIKQLAQTLQPARMQLYELGSETFFKYSREFTSPCQD